MPPRPPVPPSAPRRSPDFMTYPYPETERIWVHLETLSGVKEESKRCIANLLNYRAVRTRARLPRGQSAAVLVPLFVGRSGDLHVLLSRRSEALREFSGDTALPGGKIDAQDVTVEDTARREAFEEIGLPQDKERVPLLCVMEPRLAKGKMLVTPVVVLILDNGLQPNLNSSEVTSIFAQPLVSFLSSTPYLSGGRTADPERPYHTFTDIPWSDGGAVRLHRFLTGREAEGIKPVFGLTAAILIKTASIGYGRQPEFELEPPNAPTPAQQIAHALLTPANPLRIACEREGVDANKAAARLLRPPMAANAPRTIEWEKIGTEWKKLVDGDSATRVDGAVGSLRRKHWERSSGGGGGGKGLLQKRIDEMKKQRVQDQEGMEGLGAKIEEYKKQARERTEENGEERLDRGEERQDVVPDIAKLGAFLDETRDMVNERMKEVMGDEKKLAKARKTYPKIMERVKKQLDEARNEDGELDPKALFAKIPKEGQEGLKHGIEAGIEGIKRGVGQVDDEAGKEQGIERGKEGVRRGLEEMRKYAGKNGSDGHNPEQTSHKKRDAKL